VPNAITRQQGFEDGRQQQRPTAGTGDVAPWLGNDAVLVNTDGSKGAVHS
jgi:type VI protein secretion system component VasK